MKCRAVIEHAVGESRAAIYERRRLVELHVRRWSRASFPHVGEVWTGQVSAIDPSIGGVFVDLGMGPAGLLPFKGQSDLPRLTQGEFISVVIKREAIADKGPVLRFEGSAEQKTVGRIQSVNLEAYLQTRFPGIELEEASVSAIDQATERKIALSGGGTLTLDRTQALIAIDIDKGQAERTFDCALQAAKTAMSQLRLRGLGGLIIIDFPNLRQPKQRSQIIRTLEEYGDQDLASVRVAPFSRFGVVELTRGQDGSSLDEKLNDRLGNPKIETMALRALRTLEREGRSAPGAKLIFEGTPPILDWLDQAPFDWRSEMVSRLGARFSVRLADSVSVRADR